MSHPVPDKAEIAIEYPDKLYIGTFERTANFDACCEPNGIAISFHQIGISDQRKSVSIHLRGALFADILNELAKSANLLSSDAGHRAEVGKAVKALSDALASAALADESSTGVDDLTPDQAVRILHILE